MSVHTLLVAAFPAEFQTALTQVTSGSTQVYTATKPRPASTTVEVWVRPPLDIEGDGGGAGDPQVRRPYRVRIEKTGGSHTDLEEISREVYRHFHGRRRPNVAGLRYCRVENLIQDLHPGEAPNVGLSFDLVATTREPQSTA